MNATPNRMARFVCGLFAFCVSLTLAAGCGATKQRRAVPPDQINTATPAGFPSDIRFWGDQLTPELEEAIVQAWQQTRQDRALASGAELPESNWLALSGGGADGAFGAGLLYGWSQTGTRPEFEVVTGISTGALIAPFAFLGNAYDEQLKTIYTTVESKDIAVFQGIFTLLRSDAAYSTAPLESLTSKYINETFVDAIGREHLRGRRLLIGTTHLDAQRPVVWDMGRIALSEHPDRVKLFRDVLIASAAIPAVFPPVYVKVTGADGEAYDEMHVDGGVTRELFLRASELDMGHLRKQHNAFRSINVFLIRNSRLGPEYGTIQPRIGPIAKRSMSTLIKVQSHEELVLLHDECKASGMRFHLAAIPDHIPADGKGLFDKTYMNKLFELGESTAKNSDHWITDPRHRMPTTHRGN